MSRDREPARPAPGRLDASGARAAARPRRAAFQGRDQDRARGLPRRRAALLRTLGRGSALAAARREARGQHPLGGRRARAARGPAGGGGGIRRAQGSACDHSAMVQCPGTKQVPGILAGGEHRGVQGPGGTRQLAQAQARRFVRQPLSHPPAQRRLAARRARSEARGAARSRRAQLFRPATLRPRGSAISTASPTGSSAA